jgi:hypothetical protein
MELTAEEMRCLAYKKARDFGKDTHANDGAPTEGRPL